MATTTKNYKQTSHLPRVIYTEPAPLSGMNYTNTPLQPGYARIVYNLVENPEGTGLRARPGAKEVSVYSGVLPVLTLLNKLEFDPLLSRYFVTEETPLDNEFIKMNAQYKYNYNRYTVDYVNSEYGAIIHSLYKHREDCYIYNNSKFRNKEPYVLGAPLINNEKTYDTGKYTVVPLYNNNSKLVYTKGFETNDLFMFTKVGRHAINKSQIFFSDNIVWYKVTYADYINPKLYDNNKILPRYQKATRDSVDDNFSYSWSPLPNYYPRYYDYKRRYEKVPNNSILQIPDVLYIYYDINSENIPIGFEQDNTIYITFSYRNEFSDIANSANFVKEENTPVVVYKLPSIEVDDFRTNSQDLNHQTPAYSIKLTNIKIKKTNNASPYYFNYKYKIDTSLGYTYTINFWAYPGEHSIKTSEGYYDIFTNLKYQNIPKGMFFQEVSLSSDNLTDADKGCYSKIPTETAAISKAKNNNTLFLKIYDIPEKTKYFTPFEFTTDEYYDDNSNLYKYFPSTYINIDEISFGIDNYLKICYANLASIVDLEQEVACPDITIDYYFEDYSDAPQEIKPKVPTVKEALTYGYNMLLNNPYTFTGNKSSSTENYIQFGGLLTYDKNDNIVLNPVSNVTYKFKVIADTSSSTVPACMLIDYKTAAQDVWTKINTDFETPNELLILSDFSGQNNKEISFEWTPNVTNAIIRIRFYAKTENSLYQDTFASEELLKEFLEKATSDTFDGTIFEVTSRSVPIYYQATYDTAGSYTIAVVYYPEAESKTEDDLFAKGYRNILTNAITMSFERNYESNVNVKNYDFSTAQGMTYWYNRLVVWGVDSGANVLFFSDINDPSYFPYPNNISVFDEPVIKAVPFQDDLLVFTTTKIWKITLSEDGMFWYEKCIQKNLRVTEQEAHLIMPLTNIVFFKSGLYYYLLTPSSKGTGELVIASISKPIIDILQSPTSFFLELETQVYGNKHYTVYLRETNVYLDSSEIHVVYSYSAALFNDNNVEEATDKTVFAPTLRNYILSYNINTRKWRVWSFDSDTVPRVLYRDSVNNAVWYVLSSRYEDSKYEDLVNYTSLIFHNNIHAFQFLLYDAHDAEYNKQNIDYGIPGSHIYYQYLDTGNRDIRKEYYKKFREYQVHFNNRSNNDLKFYIEFSLDDNPVIPLYSGSVEPVADLGYAYNLNPEAETTIYGTVTALREGLEYTVDKTMWNLFHLMKCKAPITSKGYYPALHILSKNTYSYDMLDITWVYRLKNAR